jgi:DNA-3-methyladenine glycosylase
LGIIHLTHAFFDRNPLVVARALLGKVLCVKYRSVWLKAIITETEAYYLDDKASHAYLGYTEKRRALFMKPGTIYMYYSRGGDSLNISCRGEGNAVLVKSALPFTKEKGAERMVQLMQYLNPKKNSKEVRSRENLCSGQALLCKALNLKVSEWDQKQFDRKKFYLAAYGYQPRDILQIKRLGIPNGRDEHLPYRFVWSDAKSWLL